MTDCHKFEPSGQARAGLEAHLPTGALWRGFRITGKVMYRLAGAFARLFDDQSSALCRLVQELSPYSTEEMIREWETAVGLPDSCFPPARDLKERRARVVMRLARRRYTTIESWYQLASLMGIDVKITPGNFLKCDQGFSYDFPLVFGGEIKGGVYRVYIEANECQSSKGFPYQFPLVFGETSSKCAEFRCIIERIRPSYCIVIWGPPPTC